MDACNICTPNVDCLQNVMVFEIDLESEVRIRWTKFHLQELQRESDGMVKEI